MKGMVDETLEPAQDGSANTVPQAPSPDTSAAAAVASNPPESRANPGTVTAVEEHRMPFHEVHPSHARIRTWRDFFVHITTIVVGLLIAIGLEQSVEYVHHRHQLQETRRELSREVDDNRRIVEFNIESTRKASLALDADIAILRAQQSSRSLVPKKLDYTWEPWDTRDGTWQAAKQSGSLSLMPHDELRRYSHRLRGPRRLHGCVTRIRNPNGSRSCDCTSERQTAICHRGILRNLYPRPLRHRAG